MTRHQNDKILFLSKRRNEASEVFLVSTQIVKFANGITRLVSTCKMHEILNYHQKYSSNNCVTNFNIGLCLDIISKENVKFVESCARK